MRSADPRSATPSTLSSEATLEIALYENAQDNKAKVADLTWPELRQELRNVKLTPCSPCPGKTCPEKNSQCWSPISLREPKRASENVTAIHAMVFDLDGVGQDDVEKLNAIEEAGLTHVIHSTHSHSPTLDGSAGWCLRVILPLAVPFERGNLSHDEYRKRWVLARKQVAERFGIKADPTTKDLARIYFWGTCPSGDVEPDQYVGESLPDYSLISTSFEGQPLGISVVPEVLKNVTSIQQVSTPNDPSIDANQVVDIFEARKALRKTRDPDKLALVARVLAGEPLAEPGARDDTINTFSSYVAWTLPRLPVAAYLELVRPSLIPHAEPEGLEFWLDKAKTSFERALARLQEKRTE